MMGRIQIIVDCNIDPVGLWSCGDYGACIQSVHKCDGNRDCLNGNDEGDPSCSAGKANMNENGSGEEDRFESEK